MSEEKSAAQAGRPEIVVETIADHVVQIRIDRPDRLNALGYATSRELLAALETVVASKTRVLLFRGTGRAFCTGADLKERRTMDAETRSAHNLAINAGIALIAKAPMATVAVINGPALGGGCELALACDMRIAAADASIGLTESRIGAIPGAGGTQRLPRRIGAAFALEMMLTGEPVTGTRAAEIGLVNMAVPAADLDARAAAFAKLLASRSPNGAREIKRLVYEGMEMPLAQGLQKEREALLRILGSADYAEGLAAFAQKRPANFSGE
jgi:enoyl-CoA hydratase/carnithine racemase